MMEKSMDSGSFMAVDLCLDAAYVAAVACIDLDKLTLIDEEGNLDSRACLDSSGLECVGCGIALEARLGVCDLEHGLHRHLGVKHSVGGCVRHNLYGVTLLHEGSACHEFLADGNLLECLVIHEDIILAVGVEILVGAALHAYILEFLADVEAALDRINSENGTSFELNIYTGEKDPEILGEIEKYRSVKLRGFVSGAEMECAFNASDILLHTEAFDEENIDAVRHSVSTKIADALAGGIPLIAYGPAEIASVSYLQRTDSALCITSPDELYERLREVFVEKKDMTAIVLNALGTARKNHVSQLNSQLVRKIISDAAHNT